LDDLFPPYPRKDIPDLAWLNLLTQSGWQHLAELVFDLGLPKCTKRQVVGFAVFANIDEQIEIVLSPNPGLGFRLKKTVSVRGHGVGLK
jgi:hypothetical protein